MNKTVLKKNAARVISVILLITALLSMGLFSIESSAVGTNENEISTRALTDEIKPVLSPVPSRSVWKYSSYPITLNGSKISGNALMINGTIYIPMRAVATKLGLSVNYNSTKRTLKISGSGLDLTATDGSYVVYVNDRPLFTGENAAVMSDGRMYLPIDTALKAFGLRYSRNTGGGVLISGTFKPLTHASKFYRSDEVLWLSRIISAESRGEPLLGQIAVGSVVMNRVASKYYPNTIYGVIFDRNYGVQFSPVLDGTIYNTPTYNCTLAAKICLEGTRVGSNALFFLRPEASNSLWIPQSRPYLFSIGNHDFYA